MADGQNTDGLDLVKGKGTFNITNCYKTTDAGTYGMQPYTSVPANEICKQITVNTTTYYMPCTVSCAQVYKYTGSSISVTPTIFFGSTPLNVGTDYTYTISPSTVQAKGDYTLTITAQGDTYHGTKSIHVVVTDGVAITSTSTELSNGNYTVYANGTPTGFVREQAGTYIRSTLGCDKLLTILQQAAALTTRSERWRLQLLAYITWRTGNLGGRKSS